MVNIWDYIYRIVRLTDKRGSVYTGDVIEISPAEDIGETEDNLSLELKNGRILGFFPSEIESIQIL